MDRDSSENAKESSLVGRHKTHLSLVRPVFSYTVQCLELLRTCPFPQVVSVLVGGWLRSTGPPQHSFYKIFHPTQAEFNRITNRNPEIVAETFWTAKVTRTGHILSSVLFEFSNFLNVPALAIFLSNFPGLTFDLHNRNISLFNSDRFATLYKLISVNIFFFLLKLQICKWEFCFLQKNGWKHAKGTNRVRLLQMKKGYCWYYVFLVSCVSIQYSYIYSQIGLNYSGWVPMVALFGNNSIEFGQEAWISL